MSALIERFVEKINARPREPENPESVPVPCRLPCSDYPDAFEWQMVRSHESSWIRGLEQRAGLRFPTVFRELIGDYLFPQFTCGPLTIYAVGLSEQSPQFEFEDLRGVIFKDDALTNFLLPRYMLPFARPYTLDYDPICFDFREDPKSKDAPVIRVDHEAIFIKNRLRISEHIAPSFRELLTKFVGDPNEMKS
jgi:hypothetical protein